jgi:DNA-binding transcriptional MerR regulator
MKSREVTRLLNISRNTLHNYVKRGLIKMPNNDAFYKAFGITDGKMWIPMDKRVKVW